MAKGYKVTFADGYPHQGHQVLHFRLGLQTLDCEELNHVKIPYEEHAASALLEAYKDDKVKAIEPY